MYLAVSVAALALSLPLFTQYYGKLSSTGSSLQFAGFVGMLNGAMDGYSASFGAYVPKGICNSSVSGVAMATPYGSFLLSGRIALDPGLCLAVGKFAKVDVLRLPNGTFQVGVG